MKKSKSQIIFITALLCGIKLHGMANRATEVRGLLKHFNNRDVLSRNIGKSTTENFTEKNYRYFSSDRINRPTIPQIDNKGFRDIAQYTVRYILENKECLAYQKNESGFVRLSIPRYKELSEKIEKIRLNYWPDNEQVKISSESIHNHPRYFESLVIEGGYNHALYKHSKEKKMEYERYRLFKNNQSDKKFTYMGLANLEQMWKQQVGRDSVICFPKTLIHRVLRTDPSTLSINVIFKDSIQQPAYDVYISKEGNLSDVKVTREFVVDEEAELYTDQIIAFLEKFLGRDIN